MIWEYCLQFSPLSLMNLNRNIFKISDAISLIFWPVIKAAFSSPSKLRVLGLSVKVNSLATSGSTEALINYNNNFLKIGSSMKLFMMLIIFPSKIFKSSTNLISLWYNFFIFYSSTSFICPYLWSFVTLLSLSVQIFTIS